MVLRPEILKFKTVTLRIPVFFPSVSTVKTNLSPLEYVKVLRSLQSPQFLLSAFDLHHTTLEAQEYLLKLLLEAKDSGVVVLLDSGKYESYWKEKHDLWSQDDFHRILSDYDCALAFGFDEQKPPDDFETHVRLICDQQRHDQSVAPRTTVIPIVHDQPERLPRLCAKISDIIGVPMIAVPERRLGNSIFERARCVEKIRCAMNATGRYVGLHLLGTGNPISIAAYTLSGADSFDGLEWCQTVVDHETALLFHFSQADFFRTQTMWGETEMGFQARTLAHNLEFYKIWMDRLRKDIAEDRGKDFCKVHFPLQIFAKYAREMGWEV